MNWWGDVVGGWLGMGVEQLNLRLMELPGRG